LHKAALEVELIPSDFRDPPNPPSPLVKVNDSTLATTSCSRWWGVLLCCTISCSSLAQVKERERKKVTFCYGKKTLFFEKNGLFLKKNGLFLKMKKRKVTFFSLHLGR